MYKMRKIYTLCLMLVLSASMALAQQIAFQSEWQGKDNVTLRFSLTVPDSLQRSNYAVWVMPFVHNGQGDTLQLDPVVFRGKKNKKYIDRARYFGDVPAPLADEVAMASEKDCRYTLSTATAPWLLEGRIEVEARMEKEGCCEVICLPQRHYGHFAYVPAFEPQVAKQTEQVSKAVVLRQTNPVLAPISDYRPYDRTRILRKEKGMLYVYHPFDDDKLVRDFRENAPVLDRIVELTREIMADSNSTVKLIQIIGMASMEGREQYNENLAMQRAKSMQRYIQERVAVPDSLFELCNGGEGWAEFRDQINESSFEGRDEMLSIIDNTANLAQREYKIKRLMGGKPYQYVKNNILADQRNSGYLRIYFDHVPDENAKVINAGAELVRLERYAEAVEVLQAVRDDSRSWNALGVALYMSGQEEAGMEYLRRAANSGNVEAQRNIQLYDAVKTAEKAAQ